MSLESAKAFVKKMQEDEEFKKKVIDCKDVEERNVFVKSQGFDFIGAEIKDSIMELSEEEIEEMSGGNGPIDCWTTNTGCSGDWIHMW